jgi:hypothetical protein
LLDGTWTDLALSFAIWSAAVAAPVAFILGLLPRTKTRSWLIWVWAFLPLFICLLALIGQPKGLAVFLALVLSAALPSWAGLSALFYNITIRVRHSMREKR